MSKELDIDDVAETSNLAKSELAKLRQLSKLNEPMGLIPKIDFPCIPMLVNGIEYFGLTKRELFTVIAMHAHIVNDHCKELSSEDIVRYAINYSDELIRQLDKS